jgi:signal transduction histidine kinase
MQDVVKSMRLESLTGTSLNLLGRVSLHLGELDRARAYLQNAEVANRKFGDEQQLANTYALQARSWQHLNNQDQAKEVIDRAIATIKPTREKDDYIQHLILQSEIAREQGEDSTALNSALKADSIARSINAMGPVMRQVYQQMADLNLTIGDSAAALRNYLSLQSVNDSLRTRNIREMLLEKENSEQRAQLEALDTENHRKEITISRSKILLLAAAGAIVVISLLLVTLWRSSIRRKRYSKHLLTKNKEINSQKKKLSEQQEELLEKNKQLQELDKNKNKIFSVLSHDLRQPINQIRSILDLIENEELSAAERKQIVESMRQSLDNSSNALENLLLWSKNQLTGISTKIVDVHLLPQVWQLESHLKPTLDTKNLKLKLEIPDFFKVPADMNQLDICLKNLVNNAIKFSNTGGTITIKAYQKSDKKYIDVSDEGVGMTPDQLTKLRKLNGSFSTMGTMNEKGTGLGIMITQDFMINQNGDLEVESTPGKGTTFSMVFPKGEDRPRSNGSLRKI